MSNSTAIAVEEWRLWLRSRVVKTATAVFLAILVATCISSVVNILEARHERAHHQVEAEEQFYDQPARHPHRMVHYGHYVYRTPSALSVFDPGLDALTGQTIFLEGHRQNSAAFADASATAELGAFSHLTPALAYQLFAPLILILLGHNVISRERVASTLTLLLSQGVTGGVLLLGKALALLMAVGLLLVPLLVTGAVAILNGESLLVVGVLLLTYASYLVIWSLLALLASAIAPRQSDALVLLTAAWLVSSLLLPSLAVTEVSQRSSALGYIQSNLTMQADLRKLGDGHDASDPAFEALKQRLLAEHGVDSVEELPMNFRGVVSEYNEGKVTELLNEYAEARMQTESAQNALLLKYGWIAPILPLMEASRVLSGSDIANHHAFLRKAEETRFEFVQGLNRLHAQKLSLADDLQRSSDPEAEQRTRLGAEHWSVLERFEFRPMPYELRIGSAWSSISILLSWLLILMIAIGFAGRRLSP